MKKKTLFVKLTWAVLAFVMALAACPNPAGNSTGRDADKTALATAIANAEREKDSVVINSNPANVPLGTQCVTQTQWNDFEEALNSATGVRDNSSATQSQVNDATTHLNNAIAAFRSAKIAGTATPVDKSALIAKITEAKFTKDSAVQADNAAAVAQGASWATVSQHTALANAIAAAESVRNTATAQPAVDTAAATLSSAITAFNSAVSVNGPGTKSSGFDQNALSELIARANAAKAGVLASINGWDVPPTSAWVLSSVLTALENAIATASNNPADSNNAYLALSGVLEAFNSAKQPGAVPDKQPLFTAIGNADTARAGVVIAANSGEAPLGSAWVTQAQWDALEAVYTASLVTANEPGAAKNQVDEARTNLLNAVTTFNAAKSANGLGTAVNRITITGLQAVYDNGIEVWGGIFDSKITDGGPAISGSGTVSNGSLTLELSDYNGAWAGSGSYYFAFTSDQAIIFISKEKIAFNGGTVTKTYAEFELVVYSLKLGDAGDVTFTSNMTLNDFLLAVTAQMPGGPYNYEGWKAAMKAMVEDELGESLNTKIALDYTLYKNEACTQPFSGSDRVNADTVIYCRAPLGGGDSEPVGPAVDAAGYITGTISFTGYTGTRPQVRINAESDFYGGGYGWVDDRVSSYTVNADGSFSIPFVQDFLSALQSGQRELRFHLYIGSGSNQYSKTLESTVTVTVSQLSGDTLNIGAIGPVSLASITLSGTINVTVNGQRVPNVQISAYTQSYTYIGSTQINNPGANASWSLIMAPLSSPADVRFDVTGYDSNWNRIFRRDTAAAVSGVYNADKPGITINLGNISTITLSGTIDVTIDGQKPYTVEINAYTDPANPYSSQIGYSYINGYNTAPNTWSIQAEAPPQGSTVYFRIDMALTNNSNWSGYQTLTTTCIAPASGGSVPGIVLSYHGSGLAAPANLYVTNITASSVSLSWSSVSGASSYRIYRSTGSDGPYSQTGASYSTSYTDSGLSAGTYYYKVSTVSSSGTESPLSSYNYATATVSGGFPSSSSTPLTLDQWTNGSLSAGQAQWYSFTASGGTYSVSWIDKYTGDGGTVDIKIAAYRSDENLIFSGDDDSPRSFSGYSGTVYLKVEGYDSSSSGTYAVKYSQSAGLSAPAGLYVTNTTANSVSLNWNNVSGASSYRIYRSAGSDGSYSQTGTSYSTSYTDSGLSSGTYYYKVSAVDSGGNESPLSSYTYAMVSGGTGGSNTLTLSNAPAAYAVLVTTTTLNSSSTYAGIASNYIAIASSSTGSTATLTWLSGGTGTYNVLIYTGTETRYQNNVSFLDGSGSLNWNTMSTAGGGGGGTLTITGLPAGIYSVFAVTGNPSTYLETASVMASAPGQGAVISGTTVTWSVATPPTGTYTILLALSSTPTSMYKATNVAITGGGGTVAYSSFVLLPMGY